MEELKVKLTTIVGRMVNAINSLTNDNISMVEDLLAKDYYILTQYFNMYKEYTGQWETYRNSPDEPKA